MLCPLPLSQCCLESSAAIEIEGRLQMDGFEEVRDELKALPMAKVYEISERSVPTPPLCAARTPRRCSCSRRPT